MTESRQVTTDEDCRLNYSRLTSLSGTHSSFRTLISPCTPAARNIKRALCSSESRERMQLKCIFEKFKCFRKITEKRICTAFLVKIIALTASVFLLVSIYIFDTIYTRVRETGEKRRLILRDERERKIVTSAVNNADDVQLMMRTNVPSGENGRSPARSTFAEAGERGQSSEIIDLITQHAKKAAAPRAF